MMAFPADPLRHQPSLVATGRHSSPQLLLPGTWVRVGDVPALFLRTADDQYQVLGEIGYPLRTPAGHFVNVEILDPIDDGGVPGGVILAEVIAAARAAADAIRAMAGYSPWLTLTPEALRIVEAVERLEARET